MKQYRSDIDGLRALAIISVIAYHFFPKYLPGGFIGVDIFFVISGYLISTIIFDSLDNGNFKFIHFYRLRIKRILPALIVVLIACNIFGQISLLADEYYGLNKHILAGSTFSSNILLFNEGGYFDKNIESKPLMHLWSLAVEYQFYLIWPILLWLLWDQRKYLLQILILIFLTSFLYNLYCSKVDSIANFYLPFSRLWELVVGAILAELKLIKSKYLNLYSILGLLLIVVCLFTINDGASYPGWLAGFPVLGAALIIYSGANSWINKKILSSLILVHIGKISYPLYLWHWPILSFMIINTDHNISLFKKLLIIILTYLLSFLTYCHIEKYFRTEDGKIKTYFLSAVLFTIIGVSAYTYNTFSELLLRHQKKIYSQFTWDYEKNQQCLENYKFKESNNFAWWFCVNNKANPMVMIVGDSFANHLYPIFTNDSRFKEYGALMIGACSFVDVGTANYSFLKNHPCLKENYHSQIEFINSIIKNEKSLKILIIAGLDKTPDSYYFKKLQERIEFLSKFHLKVVLVLPHHFLPYDPRKCLSRPLTSAKDNCILILDEFTKFNNDYIYFLYKIDKLYNNVHAFDLNKVFCIESKCTFIKDGIPLLRDGAGHFSEYGLEALSPSFIEFISRIIDD